MNINLRQKRTLSGAQKLFAAFLIAAVFPRMAFAVGGNGEAAGSGLFLAEEPSARVSALAGMSLPLANEPGAMYLNPALLGHMTGGLRLACSAWNDAAAIGNYSFAYAALYRGGLGALGFGYLGYDSGKDTVYDINGNPTMSNINFESDQAFSAAWGVPLTSRLFIGGQVKAVKSTLVNTYTANALTYDAGIMYKSLNDKFTLGAGVQNLTGKLQYKKVGDTLLNVVRADMGYKISSGFGSALLGVSVQKPDNQSGIAGGGIEYAMPGLPVSLRGGVRRAGEIATGGEQVNFTAGAGLDLGVVTLDYAFQPVGDLGEPMHKFSFSMGLGGSNNVVKRAAYYYDKKDMKNKAVAMLESVSRSEPS